MALAPLALAIACLSGCGPMPARNDRSSVWSSPSSSAPASYGYPSAGASGTQGDAGSGGIPAPTSHSHSGLNQTVLDASTANQNGNTTAPCAHPPNCDHSFQPPASGTAIIPHDRTFKGILAVPAAKAAATEVSPVNQAPTPNTIRKSVKKNGVQMNAPLMNAPQMNTRQQ